jgi:formate dehydrogenase beta subunit
MWFYVPKTDLNGRFNLAEVVFSSWGGKIVDNRKGGEPEAAVFKLPENYLDEGKIGAFMGWDGVIVLDKDIDVVNMAAEYMKNVQEKYCCAKCTPGKRGTRVMMDTLSRILTGHGEESDLDTLTGLADLLDNCKCTLCMTAAKPVLDTVKYFREDYQAYLKGVRKSKKAKVLKFFSVGGCRSCWAPRPSV